MTDLRRRTPEGGYLNYKIRAAVVCHSPIVLLIRPFLFIISQLGEKLVNECYSQTVVTPLNKKKKKKQTAARDT